MDRWRRLSGGPVIRGRTYSDDEAAHALAVLKANRGNARKTSAALAIPRTTLRQWAGRAKSSNAVPKVVPAEAYEAAVGNLGTKWLQIADKGVEVTLEALQTVKPASLNMRDIKDLATAAAIATDKNQLLSGGPTSRESREIRIVYGLDPSIRSLRQLGERVIDGEVKELPSGE